MPTTFLILRIFRLSIFSGPEQVMNYLNEVHLGSTKQRINLLSIPQIDSKARTPFVLKKLQKVNKFILQVFV
jgi:hypothetical protein